MASAKISDLTDGVTANATDRIPAARAGANKYLTPAYIGTYLGVLPWSIKTANFTAVNGSRLACDTTAGAFSITLPATPATGDNVTLKGGPLCSTNNLTVARNGSTIMGLAADMTVSLDNAEFTLVYSGSTWSL